MRDNLHLNEQLAHYCAHHFDDVKLINPVEISFGRKAKTRLGSIKLVENISKITITGFFKDPNIPQYVVDETIVHEFIHYTHGFSSLHEQQYQHPHKHGIIRNECHKRDLLDLHIKSQKWIKENWHKYLQSNGVSPYRQRRTRRKSRKTYISLPTKIIRNLFS